MKKFLKMFLCLMLALSLSIAFAACADNGKGTQDDQNPPNGQDEDSDKTEGGTAEQKTYYEVTVVNGSIGETNYNHDKVEENTSVTVVANDAIGTESFVYWEMNGKSVSTDESYTFNVTENVTLTAYLILNSVCGTVNILKKLRQNIRKTRITA